jgi:Domain of unknown function (DUF4287)
MPLDRTKLHQGFKTYLENAEKASGKTYDDFAKTLAKSALTKHGDLRAHLMEQTGLGHGHANAVVAIWLRFSGAPAAAPAKKAAVAPAKKAAANKAPAKKK